MIEFKGHTPIRGPENDYQGPVAGLSAEADSWKAAVEKINGQFKELFHRVETGAEDIIKSLHARIEDLEGRLTAALAGKADKTIVAGTLTDPGNNHFVLDVGSLPITQLTPVAPLTPAVAEPAPVSSPAPAPASTSAPLDVPGAQAEPAPPDPLAALGQQIAGTPEAAS